MNEQQQRLKHAFRDIEAGKSLFEIGDQEECPYCGPDGTDYSEGGSGHICQHCGGSHIKKEETP